MIQHKEQRVGVFVDVSNMYYSAKNLYKARVHFGKILEHAVAGRKLIRAVAYVIKAEKGEEEKFFMALDKQGFEVRMKDLQVFYGGMKKGDWDVGMTIDIVRMSEALDVVVLVTGDGDFVPTVEYVQYHNGRLVEVMAFGKTCSAKLQAAADAFVDMDAHTKKFLLRTN